MKYVTFFLTSLIILPLQSEASQETISIICKITETISGKDGTTILAPEVRKTTSSYVFKQEVAEIAIQINDFSKVPATSNKIDPQNKLIWTVNVNGDQLSPLDLKTINSNGSVTYRNVFISVDENIVGYRSHYSNTEIDGRTLRLLDETTITVNRVSGQLTGKTIAIHRAIEGHSATEISGNCSKGTKLF